MEGTVISDTVNLASRLEGLTKVYGVSILISEQTLNCIEDKTKYSYRFLDKVQVKGKNQPVMLYEIFDGINPARQNEKIKMVENFNKVLSAYYDKKFNDALKYFTLLKQKNPDDKLFDVYIKRCENFIKYGLPDNWNGVEVLDSK
jgi:two-component system, sensor histidine kinase ChiS